MNHCVSQFLELRQQKKPIRTGLEITVSMLMKTKLTPLLILPVSLMTSKHYLDVRPASGCPIYSVTLAATMAAVFDVISLLRVRVSMCSWPMTQLVSHGRLCCTVYWCHSVKALQVTPIRLSHQLQHKRYQLQTINTSGVKWAKWFCDLASSSFDAVNHRLTNDTFVVTDEEKTDTITNQVTTLTPFLLPSASLCSCWFYIPLLRRRQ